MLVETVGTERVQTAQRLGRAKDIVADFADEKLLVDVIRQPTVARHQSLLAECLSSLLLFLSLFFMPLLQQRRTNG